eukprot:4164008-Prymnesium_polylepis.1
MPGVGSSVRIVLFLFFFFSQHGSDVPHATAGRPLGGLWPMSMVRRKAVSIERYAALRCPYLARGRCR